MSITYSFCHKWEPFSNSGTHQVKIVKMIEECLELRSFRTNYINVRRNKYQFGKKTLHLLEFSTSLCCFTRTLHVDFHRLIIGDSCIKSCSTSHKQQEMMFSYSSISGINTQILIIHHIGFKIEDYMKLKYKFHALLGFSFAYKSVILNEKI